MTVVALEIPMKLPSCANMREHWRARAARVKKQRQAVTWHWLVQVGRFAYRPPFLVTLTRESPRRLDDDNLASAFKAVRDEVAKHLDVDDGREDLIRWVYAQRTGPPGVLIEIRTREAT